MSVHFGRQGGRRGRRRSTGGQLSPLDTVCSLGESPDAFPPSATGVLDHEKLNRSRRRSFSLGPRRALDPICLGGLMPGSLRVRPARALVLSVLSASVAFAVAGSAASAATPASGGHGDDRAAQRWLGTWAAGMLPAAGTPTSTAGFTNETVRQTIHVSVGGPGVRLELANTFGNGPLQVADVDVALPAG